MRKGAITRIAAMASMPLDRGEILEEKMVLMIGFPLRPIERQITATEPFLS
jgi:hypothetical protein